MKLKKIAVSSDIKPLVDVPVAINFYARPDTFEQVFERVREVRPTYLFLLSDGPRDTVKTDAENVRKCREIAENVDWECDLYHLYAEKNKGIFDTYFDGMKQVFGVVDRCIFLEDDCVVAKSFFEFSKVLLEKYKDDLRVNFINAFNIMGVNERVDADYFFSGESAVSGYALWKRTFDNMNLSLFDDSYALDCVIDCAKQIKPGYERRILKTFKNPNWEGHIPHVEFHKNLMRFSQNQIFIVPTRNMLKYVGIAGNSLHTTDDPRKLPKKVLAILTRDSYEIDFPIKHPRYCVRDLKFESDVNKALAWNRPHILFLRRIEVLFRHIIYGDFKSIGCRIKRIFIKDNRI